MRKIVSFANVSLLAGAVCLSSAAFAAPPAKSPTAPAAASSSKAKAAKPMTHTASGTVESYDATGKTLTVKGSKSTWTFSTADARVWQGSKSIGVEDLASHTGAKVTVKYTESGGQKSATSVRLAPAHAMRSAAKK